MNEFIENVDNVIAKKLDLKLKLKIYNKTQVILRTYKTNYFAVYSGYEERIVNLLKMPYHLWLYIYYDDFRRTTDDGMNFSDDFKKVLEYYNLEFDNPDPDSENFDDEWDEIDNEINILTKEILLSNVFISNFDFEELFRYFLPRILMINGEIYNQKDYERISKYLKNPSTYEEYLIEVEEIKNSTFLNKNIKTIIKESIILKDVENKDMNTFKDILYNLGYFAMMNPFYTNEKYIDLNTNNKYEIIHHEGESG